MVMNGKTIFGLMVCIMAGQPLQGCCFRASGGATTSLLWLENIMLPIGYLIPFYFVFGGVALTISAHTFFITKLRGRASRAVSRMTRIV